MKKLLLLVTVVTLGLGAGGCAGVLWNASFYETTTVGNAEKMMGDVGAKEVAQYTVIFGVPLGYETFAGLISSELRRGGRLHLVEKNYLIYRQVSGFIISN
jgi:hypothetical protein